MEKNSRNVLSLMIINFKTKICWFNIFSTAIFINGVFTLLIEKNLPQENEPEYQTIQNHLVNQGKY